MDLVACLSYYCCYFCSEEKGAEKETRSNKLFEDMDVSFSSVGDMKYCP